MLRNEKKIYLFSCHLPFACCRRCHFGIAKDLLEKLYDAKERRWTWTVWHWLSSIALWKELMPFVKTLSTANIVQDWRVRQALSLDSAFYNWMKAQKCQMYIVYERCGVCVFLLFGSSRYYCCLDVCCVCVACLAGWHVSTVDCALCLCALFFRCSTRNSVIKLEWQMKTYQRQRMNDVRELFLMYFVSPMAAGTLIVCVCVSVCTSHKIQFPFENCFNELLSWRLFDPWVMAHVLSWHFLIKINFWWNSASFRIE